MNYWRAINVKTDYGFIPLAYYGVILSFYYVGYRDIKAYKGSSTLDLSEGIQ